MVSNLVFLLIEYICLSQLISSQGRNLEQSNSTWLRCHLGETGNPEKSILWLYCSRLALFGVESSSFQCVICQTPTISLELSKWQMKFWLLLHFNYYVCLQFYVAEFFIDESKGAIYIRFQQFQNLSRLLLRSNRILCPHLSTHLCINFLVFGLVNSSPISIEFLRLGTELEVEDTPRNPSTCCHGYCILGRTVWHNKINKLQEKY